MCSMSNNNLMLTEKSISCMRMDRYSPSTCSGPRLVQKVIEGFIFGSALVAAWQRLYDFQDS